MRKKYLEFDERGSIVIYLLILISLLFFLVFRALFYSKMTLLLVNNEVKKEEIKNKILLITDVVSNLIKKRELYDSFFDNGFFEFYKKPNFLKIDDKKYLIKVESEKDKVNLNTSSDFKIKQVVFEKLKDDFPYEFLDSISDKILDWRDKDNYVRAHGAEKDEYKNLGYLPKNGNFSSIFELKYVKDVNENVFKKLIEIFTIYGKNVYRFYLKINKNEYLVFFYNTSKGFRILDWGKI